MKKILILSFLAFVYWFFIRKNELVKNESEERGPFSDLLPTSSTSSAIKPPVSTNTSSSGSTTTSGTTTSSGNTDIPPAQIVTESPTIPVGYGKTVPDKSAFTNFSNPVKSAFK